MPLITFTFIDLASASIIIYHIARTTVNWINICIFTFACRSVLNKSFCAWLTNGPTLALAGDSVELIRVDARCLACFEIKALAGCPIQSCCVLTLHWLPICVAHAGTVARSP